MFKPIATIIFASLLFAGCATVPMESMELSNKAKEFNPPSEGHAGLYIFRVAGVGTALKKDVWVDDKCIGETAQDVFFYEEVTGGELHKVSTESEFSPNILEVKTESGEHYFIKQYIKLGVFVGGAKLELVDDEKGREYVSKIKLAKKGKCSK